MAELEKGKPISLEELMVTESRAKLILSRVCKGEKIVQRQVRKIFDLTPWHFDCFFLTACGSLFFWLLPLEWVIYTS